jgi:hypothetical protein
VSRCVVDALFDTQLGWLGQIGIPLVDSAAHLASRAVSTGHRRNESARPANELAAMGAANCSVLSSRAQKSYSPGYPSAWISRRLGIQTGNKNTEMMARTESILLLFFASDTETTVGWIRGAGRGIEGRGWTFFDAFASRASQCGSMAFIALAQMERDIMWSTQVCPGASMKVSEAAASICQKQRLQSRR